MTEEEEEDTSDCNRCVSVPSTEMLASVTSSVVERNHHRDSDDDDDDDDDDSDDAICTVGG